MIKYTKILTLGLTMGLAPCGFSQMQQNGQIKPHMATNTLATSIPLKDFFKNPEKSRYQISPDGQYFSFLASFQNRMNIFIQKIGSTEATKVTSVTDQDIRSYFWANENQLLYLKDNGGDENDQLFAVDKDGKNFKALTPFDGVKTTIIEKIEEKPEEIIIGLNKRNAQVFDPYRLNIKTGEMVMVAENPGNITGWVTDHDGQVRMATATDGVSVSVLYRNTEKDEFKKIVTTSFKESLEPLLFTPDNKNIYAASNIGRDKNAIVMLDPTTGKELQKIYENPEYDVSNIAYSKKRKVVTAVVYTGWKREVHFLDDETKKMYQRLNKDLGKYEVVVIGKNKAEDRFIVRTFSDRSLGAHYIYDKKTDKLDKIADVSPWIKEEEMAEVKPIKYTSRDGFTIHGYLTLPKGKTAKNLPVVVNPHGGPWARDEWGFNPELQFLANRGYAVLQVNFRGSTGYGKKFWEASFKQWGLKMQDDITDGVNWLIKEGIANPKRVAIYGGSYGGYATLAGLTYTPDLYACGIDYVGVSNLFTFMNTIPPYWKPFLEMMYAMVGDPEKDKDMLTKSSPALNADKIKAPLLVAQGAKDPRVNKAESDQMVEALKKRGVTVEYIVKDNEGHGFHNEENRFEFYEAMEKFLAKHMNK